MYIRVSCYFLFVTFFIAGKSHQTSHLGIGTVLVENNLVVGLAHYATTDKLLSFYMLRQLEMIVQIFDFICQRTVCK